VELELLVVVTDGMRRTPTARVGVANPRLEVRDPFGRWRAQCSTEQRAGSIPAASIVITVIPDERPPGHPVRTSYTQRMPEVRRWVTVIFTDITGSTALAERLEPETVHNVLGSFFEAMRPVLERHGGTIEKYIGDAIMAVFGVPRVHEDDALRAVRAAAEMRGALARLNDELVEWAGVRLETRTGITSGEVVADDTGEKEWLVSGDTVNVAARLQQAAAPGEILIGDDTRRLAAAALELEAMAPLTVKGKSEPLTAWRLLGVRDSASAFVRRLDAPMVGRREELRLLREAAGAAFATRVPHALTLLGQAGIGKSRLVNELVAGLDEETRILLGRCLPYGEGITFWPLAEIVRQAGLPAEAFAGTSAQQTFWKARVLLERLARERPLLVVFDDIHWGEATFLDLLEYLRASLVDVPVVLLLQARPELVEVRPSWTAPAPNASTVELRPLSPSESRELAAAAGEDAIERIVLRAEGNPLFIEQMLTMLQEGGDIEKMPATIRAVLAARLDRLERAERDVLDRASVEGAIFQRRVVEALLPDAERESLGARLTELVRKGLIRPDRSALAADDAFRFSHLLIRDAVYAGITKDARAAYHEALGGWLGRAVSPEGAGYDEILGYHYEQAFLYRAELGPTNGSVRELGERAASLLEGAGRRAYARSDVSAAVSLLGRAAALPASGLPERVELALVLSLALDFGGQSRRAAEVAADGFAVAESLGDARLLALARAQAGAVALHTDPSATAAGYERVLEQTIAQCEDAGDEYHLALSRRRLGWVQQVEGRYGASILELERAARHAARAGHAREETLALAMLTEALAYGPTPAGEAISRCEEILEQPDTELAVQRAAARSSLALLHAMRGDTERARVQANLSWSALEPFGDRHAAAQGAMTLGLVELLADDAVAAEAVLRRGYEPLAEMGDTSFLARIAALLAEAVRRQGRDEPSLKLTEEAAALAAHDDFVTHCSWKTTAALARAARGEHVEALRLARESLDAVERTDAVVAHGDALIGLAEALRAAGADADARRAAVHAGELYEQKGDLVDAGRARALRDDLGALTPGGRAL
jgi:class 3 adenylate cyclase/predicted ATPase